MPRILVFAPCEKLIVSDDNTTSLITLLESINFALPESEDEKIKEGTVVPMRWYALALWEREEGDKDGQRFEQRIQMQLPDGRILSHPSLMFELQKEVPNYRSTFVMVGFPISKAGKINFSLSLREVGKEDDWREVASFPIHFMRNVNEA